MTLILAALRTPGKRLLAELGGLGVGWKVQTLGVGAGLKPAPCPAITSDG